MRSVAALFVIASLALPQAGMATGPARDLTRADVEAWLDGFLPYGLARDDVAGAAVVVIKGGGILTARGYGRADTVRGTPVDPGRTLFRTGSVGKLFTWTAVMQQVEAGRLELDRDINDYLDFRIPLRNGQPVTLRNLMTHTPGFEEPVKRLLTDKPEQLTTIDAYLKAWTPRRIFPPGEVPAYSNYGATLAGYLVERVSGESYDDYVDRQVFAPLGMARSTTRQVLPAKFRDDMSRGYLLGSGPARSLELFGVSPAGGATTTAADMGRFMIAWLQEGEFQGNRILQPETVRRTLGTPLTVIPGLNRMLLGFHEQNLNGHRIAGHRGDTQFFHSTLNLFVDDGVGIYLVLNSSGRNGAAVALPTEFVSQFADRYFPGPGVGSTVSEATALEHARQLVGTYMSSRRQESNFLSTLSFLSQMKVTLNESGRLQIPALLAANGVPMEWREVRPYVWHQVGGKERLAARIKHGRVELIGIDSVSPFVVMQRVPWWKSSLILLPLLFVSLAVIVVALIAWPAASLVRRHYRFGPANAGAIGTHYRWARIASAGVLAALAGWTILISQLSGNLSAFSPTLDPWIALLKVVTLASCAGGCVVAFWDAIKNWTRRDFAARAGSVSLVLSLGTLLWIAAVLKLAGFGTDY